MQVIKRNLANTITLLNLFCGLISILLIMNANLYYASILIFIGSILDYIDGSLARLLKTDSKIGKQLDSFADIVTFGIAPGFILFQLIYHSNTLTFFQSISNIYNHDMLFVKDKNWQLSLIGLLIPLFSAIRLSKFNTTKSKTTYFIGLPTPAAALFIASLPLIMHYNPDYFISDYALIAISIILSLLLISEIHLFSLKIRLTKIERNELLFFQLIFLISSVILLSIFQLIAIPFIVILYIILSIINNLRV